MLPIIIAVLKLLGDGLQLHISLKFQERIEAVIQNAKMEYIRAIEKLENARAQYEKQLEKLKSSYIEGINLLKEVVSFLESRGEKVVMKEQVLRDAISFISELKSDIFDIENKTRASIRESFSLRGICNFANINMDFVELLSIINSPIKIMIPKFLLDPFDFLSWFAINFSTKAIIDEVSKFREKIAEEVLKIELEIDKIKAETIRNNERIRIITEISQSLNSRLQELKNESQLTKDQIDTLVSIAKTLKGCIFKES